MPKRKLPPPSGLSSFERGLAAESALCDLLSRASRGRLRFARPQPDDHGVDHLAYREDSSYPLRLQFKAATRAGARGGQEVIDRIISGRRPWTIINQSKDPPKRLIFGRTPN